MVTAKGMQYAAIQNTECAQYVRKINLLLNYMFLAEKQQIPIS
jgi:hypothetical protein